MTIDITDDRIWHAVKQFSHYGLGILFLFMVVAFLSIFWQIHDYSNRDEVKRWLHKYISDGWWRRGGMNVALSTLKGIVILLAVFLAMNTLATQATPVAVPESRIIGSLVAMTVSVVFIIWFLGYWCIRFTESAFVR